MMSDWRQTRVRMFWLTGALWILLACTGLCHAQTDVVLSPGQEPAAALYPVTELRLVRHPGEFHFARVYGGQYLLTDYWYEEVEVDRRVYQPVTPGYPGAVPGQARQLRKIFVEILSGQGLEFQEWSDLQSTSFTLVEDEPKQVRVRFGAAGSKLVPVVYDGYHVDFGCQQRAKVIPDMNGREQALGENPRLGLRDVAVAIYWEENPEGGVRAYSVETLPTTDGQGWASQVKERVESRRPPESAAAAVKAMQASPTPGPPSSAPGAQP